MKSKTRIVFYPLTKLQKFSIWQTASANYLISSVANLVRSLIFVAIFKILNVKKLDFNYYCPLNHNSPIATP